MESLRVVLTRVVGLAVLPAQLPGDAPGLLDDLVSQPLRTLRTCRRSLILSLSRQIIGGRKLQVPDDSQLCRLATARARFVQRGWTQCEITTSDGLHLDAMFTPPPGAARQERQAGGGQRFVLWVGGNFQKYEDWLAYFDIYARDADVGFLAFNFRGVGLSEGAVMSWADLVCDVAACVRYLQEEHAVTSDRLLLHGFSLGGAIAALFLAQPDAPRCALISDRSFRSLPHAAHSLIRGPCWPPLSPESGHAFGDAPAPDRASATATAVFSSAHATERWLARFIASCKTMLARLLPALLQWSRTVFAAIAVVALRALGWELCAETALHHVRGRCVLIFHRQDDVVLYEGASLEAALARRCALADKPNLRTLEVLGRGPQGWAIHDFPLCSDEGAWTGLMRSVAWVLNSSAKPEGSDLGTSH